MALPEGVNFTKNTQGLHTLYPPKGKKNEAVVDIVAVHGLGGDSYSSWTEKSSNILWLRDLLPEYLKEEIGEDNLDVRVLTYGYDASIFVQDAAANTKRLLNYAEALLNKLMDDSQRSTKLGSKRPIIFVGHSMGGLVIKKALNLAYARSKQYEPIVTSTKAIHFYGTPHAGADLAKWGAVLDKMASVLKFKETHAAKSLQTWSPELMDLAVEFIDRVDDLEITTFFETATQGSVIVVDEGSARLNLRKERCVGLNKNHSGLCKYASVDDVDAPTVLGRMRVDVAKLYREFQEANA